MEHEPSLLLKTKAERNALLSEANVEDVLGYFDSIGWKTSPFCRTMYFQRPWDGKVEYRFFCRFEPEAGSLYLEMGARTSGVLEDNALVIFETFKKEYANPEGEIILLDWMENTSTFLVSADLDCAGAYVHDSSDPLLNFAWCNVQHIEVLLGSLAYVRETHSAGFEERWRKEFPRRISPCGFDQWKLYALNHDDVQFLH